MVSLSYVHIIYLCLILLFLVIMACKKSIVVPCAIGILIMGFCITNSVVDSFQALFNTLVWSGTELFGIITVISLVVAMSKALSSIGADKLMISPLKKVMVNKSITFLLLGIIMFVVSLFIWPSPAVALVGALMLPISISTGVPVIWAAVAMNIFGHGMALSGDFFIQGAPTITAKSARSTAAQLMSGSVNLWIVMSLVTAVVAFICFRRDLKNNATIKVEIPQDTDKIKPSQRVVFAAVITPIAFIADIIAMISFNLQGSDATALVGATALVLLIVISIVNNGFKESLENVSESLEQGFAFGIKIFAPVIVIGGFFFLGGADAAQAVFGENVTGILSDIGIFISQNVPLSKFTVVLTQTAVAVVTGLDGSGFSGLPLVGATAATFANAINVNKEVLAALGQIITIWVGGGTLIPWGVIPVAAICNVSPMELVRKNFVPVICGMAATIIAAFILI